MGVDGYFGCSKGFQSQFTYCLMVYRSTYGTDVDNSEIASPVIGTRRIFGSGSSCGGEGCCHCGAYLIPEGSVLWARTL